MAMFARAATKAFDQGIGTLAAGAHIAQLVGGRSVTGLSITTDKAMRYSAFWSAVRILSEDQAKLPLGVHERLRDGTNRPAPEHSLHNVIHHQANPQMTAFTWREVGMAHDLVIGNTYSMIARDGTGAVRELWPLAADRMETERLATGILRFRYQRVDGSTVDLDSQDVFHVPGLSWDGVKGYSVIRQARETIGLGLAAEEHGARFFGNGATTNFVLGTDTKLSQTAIDHLADQIKDKKTGLSNAWKPWVLEEGLKPFTLSMPNDDAQWLETRKHQVTDVCRWFRIPPHKLMDLERATFTNIEHQGLEYVTDALMGWLTRWEQAIGMQLLGDDWVGQGGRFYVKFNVNALLRGDFKTRMEGYATGMQWGLTTPNLVSELEDWQQIEGGDTPLRPLTHIAVSALDDNGMTFADRVNAAAVLVRAGYEPDGVNAALSLPPIAHTGLVPITVQMDPEKVPAPSSNGTKPVGATDGTQGFPAR
jgi:HK97 family phage portal protein